MEIQIESPQFPITAALSRHLRQQLRDNLAFCAERIRQVQAHLCDVNGQRGGADKRCRLVVRLSRAPRVVVESTETDLYVAIRRAANRLGRATARRIGRQARLRRGGARRTADQDQAAGDPTGPYDSTISGDIR